MRHGIHAAFAYLHLSCMSYGIFKVPHVSLCPVTLILKTKEEAQQAKWVAEVFLWHRHGRHGTGAV